MKRGTVCTELTNCMFLTQTTMPFTTQWIQSFCTSVSQYNTVDATLRKD
jgi:hypothetical protein